jgi:ribosomal protein S18 acetylase RimI-like enzyme
VTLIYRRPTRDEAEAMAALHVQCWREAYANIVPNSLLEKSAASSRLSIWRDSLDDEKRSVFAAFEDETAIGFIVAGKSKQENFEGEDGHIFMLYLRSSYHRRGIGRQLLKLAAGQWLKQGGHSLSLSVLTANKSAIKFYEGMGASLVRVGTYKWDEYELPNAIYVFENLPALIP